MSVVRNILFSTIVCAFLVSCSYFKTDEDRILDGEPAARIPITQGVNINVPQTDAWGRVIMDDDIANGQESRDLSYGIEPTSPSAGVKIYPHDEDMRRAISIYR